MSARDQTVVNRPEGMEGWLLKKGSSGGVQLMGAEWQRRWVEGSVLHCDVIY